MNLQKGTRYALYAAAALARAWEREPVVAELALAPYDIASLRGLPIELDSSRGRRSMVAVARLRSGDVVAIVHSTRTEPSERGVTLLKVLAGDPKAALASFLQLTGIPASQVRPPG